MKSNIWFLSILLIINQVHLYLLRDQREELIAELAVKISEKNNNHIYEDALYEKGKFQRTAYDLKTILELMEKYKLPQSYNIFEHGIEKDVKNQWMWLVICFNKCFRL